MDADGTTQVETQDLGETAALLGEPYVDADGLLVALILAPATFSRNRFFSLFEQKDLSHARRRAQMVRSLVKELTEPWPHAGEIPSHPPAILESERLVDGLVVISFSVPDFGYRREAHLSPLEAAALRYCLKRAGVGSVSDAERQLVERHLCRLAPVPQNSAPQ